MYTEGRVKVCYEGVDSSGLCFSLSTRPKAVAFLVASRLFIASLKLLSVPCTEGGEGQYVLKIHSEACLRHRFFLGRAQP